MARCRALVFPGEEDFGITPLEAMSAGRPVIAYAAGGALDTVMRGARASFFPEPTPESLAEAVRGWRRCRLRGGCCGPTLSSSAVPRFQRELDALFHQELHR